MSRRPHVLIEAIAVREAPTGVARGALELLRALAAEDRGCDFTVAATASAPWDRSWM